MGENTDNCMLIHIDSNPICLVVSFILCVKKGWFYYSIFYALRQCCAVYFVGTAHWNDDKIFVYCFDFRRCIALFLLEKTIFSVRQKGGSPLLLPASMLQSPRCLV
nr:MAG TPA: hypothetical protein [Caudoviricetes sp.]